MKVSPLPCLLLLALIAPGCASRDKKPEANYQTVGRDPRRDTETARAENTHALAMIGRDDWVGAEVALKKALAADIMYGPAHNNLGKVYYRQQKLYLAAWEFEYAAKLMPNHAEPRNNMGLVFEAAGKWDDAITQYADGLKLEPENPELIGNSARARLRRGDQGPEVRSLLTKLVMIDTRPQWREWARRKLVMMPENPITATPQTTQPQ